VPLSARTAHHIVPAGKHYVADTTDPAKKDDSSAALITQCAIGDRVATNQTAHTTGCSNKQRHGGDAATTLGKGMAETLQLHNCMDRVFSLQQAWHTL